MKIIQQVNQTSGQTMGYTVIAESGHVLVIDGGTYGNGRELRRVVRKAGGHADLWCLTHPHDDHYMAIIEALAEPGIEYDRMGAPFLTDAWGKALSESDQKELADWNRFAATLGDRLFELEPGQTFQLGSMRAEILAAKNPEILTHLNDQSAVIRITENGFVFLVLGDLGVTAGRKLQATGVDLRADAVQLAHHGQSGVDEAFYRAVQPRIAFWSTPEWLWNNAFPGQPYNSGPFRTLEVRAWMEKLGTRNILDFEHTVCFDTKTETVEIY